MPEVVPINTAKWQINDIADAEKYPNGAFAITYTPHDDESEDRKHSFRRLAGRINKFSKMLGTETAHTQKSHDKIDTLRQNYDEKLRRLASEIETDDVTDYIELWRKFGTLQGEYNTLSNNIDSLEGATTFDIDALDSPEKIETLGLRLKELGPEATAEQASLSFEIKKAYDVVDIVMDRRRQQNRKNLPGLLESVSQNKKQGMTVRKNYVHQLKEIADEGLLSVHTTVYAAQKLELFKEAFVQREADRVKNHHVKVLGYWTVMFAAAFLVLIGLTLLPVVETSFLADKLAKSRVFLLLSVGACVGTWLSFSLRRVNLGFDDLILLEPDRLNPTARIIFVVILTCIIGGILDLQWIQISFAGKPLTLSDPIESALLIGTFCGIAERSLSGAIVGKADGLVGLVRQKKFTKGDE